MQSTLNKLADALASIDGLAVYHYWRPRLEAPFCIWAEDGEASALSASNRKQEQAISGTIDYFTREEFDPTVDDIQVSLNEIEELGWALNSVQYEEDTNLIHFEWRFVIAGGLDG